MVWRRRFFFLTARKKGEARKQNSCSEGVAQADLAKPSCFQLTLFITQRHRGIDAGGSSSRNITRR